jgi:hypothetical protein
MKAFPAPLARKAARCLPAAPGLYDGGTAEVPAVPGAVHVMRTLCGPVVMLAALVGWGVAAGSESRPPAGQAAEFAREPSWSQPDPRAVRARIEESLGRMPAADAATRTRLDEAWAAVAAGRGDLLDAVLESIAAREPRAAAMTAAVRRDAEPDASWLDEPPIDTALRDAVRLWWGRELVRWNRFDEALPLLAGLDVASAVDPAALLFHRAACQHWLLDADGAIESLDRLLEREGELPARYARLARLLRADAAGIERESLDHIARRMRDVGRRLALGRTGAGTRELQDGVIESLDKLIKKLEDQQQQQDQGGGGGGGGSGQGGEGAPMDDSRIAGGKGAGDVQKRDIGAEDGWGNLPPHDREQALQQIGREFPPHYREAIEQYFKRLAAGGEDR